MQETSQTEEKPVLQTETGYKVIANKAWYKPSIQVLPKKGTAVLFNDGIRIADKNGEIVFDGKLADMSKFRRSGAAIAFNTDSQVVGLSFIPLSYAAVGAIGVLGGGIGAAAAMRAAAKKFIPIAKEWQHQLEGLGIKFGKSYFGSNMP